MTHLLRIHIGPVQEFIAAARRSRDLWYGSWQLSELSKAAASAIVQSEGDINSLIFPAPDDLADLAPASDYTVTNEVSALIRGDPAAVAKAAKDAIDTRLNDLCQDALPQKLRHRLASWEMAEKQIKDLVEFYWVAVPLDEFAPARDLADSLLAARKNTRTYGPVEWGSNRRKSSLDGIRESVIPEVDVGNMDVMYEHYRARRGERLSGVDLLKRLGNAGSRSRFPSTSHVAALPLELQLAKAANNPDAVQAWNDYLGALPDRMKDQEKVAHDLHLSLLGDYDGALLFESRLADHLDDKALLSQATDKLNDFFRKADMPRPNPYYAVLVGDGDFMGEKIKTLLDDESNRAFSRTLSQFAGGARKIVAGHSGAVIFAGGDDVLAFLPLHTVVQCARELAGTFADLLADGHNNSRSPTFSAGIAIVHHLEPLEDALELARTAEKAAKAIPDGQKNALAVALDKRSGESRLVAGHWGELDVRLLNLAALHMADVIPGRMAYQMLGSYHLLGGEKAVSADGTLREILALEAERIIERKRIEGGGAEVDRSHRHYLRQLITGGQTDAASLAEELVIASLLADAVELAGGSLAFAGQEVPST